MAGRRVRYGEEQTGEVEGQNGGDEREDNWEDV